MNLSLNFAILNISIKIIINKYAIYKQNRQNLKLNLIIKIIIKGNKLINFNKYLIKDLLAKIFKLQMDLLYLFQI